MTMLRAPTAIKQGAERSRSDGLDGVERFLHMRLQLCCPIISTLSIFLLVKKWPKWFRPEKFFQHYTPIPSGYMYFLVLLEVPPIFSVPPDP